MTSKAAVAFLCAFVPLVCAGAPPSKPPATQELKFEITWGHAATIDGGFKKLIFLAASGGVGISTLGNTVALDPVTPITLPAGWNLQIVDTDYANLVYFDPCEFVVHGFTNLGGGVYEIYFQHIVCKSHTAGIPDQIDAPSGSNYYTLSYAGNFVGKTLSQVRL